MTGFLATIISFGLRFRQLDASTGASDPNDFTVRNSPFVSRAVASTAPCPSFATMAYAPLVGQDGGSCAIDLPDEASGLFFAARLDEANQLEIAEEISLAAQWLHDLFWQ